MTSRSIRRAQERREAKLARKQARLQQQHAPEQTLETEPEREAAEPAAAPEQAEISAARRIANRENAQHSTGPRTEADKARSSQNNFRYGFRSAFRLLPDEDANEYAQLLSDLRSEHAPASTTEHFLVERMAQHMWLVRRAQSLQDWQSDDPKQTAYARYELTNERAFHTCLNQLLKLRAETRKAAEAERESVRKDEYHAARVRLADSKSTWNELNAEIKGMIEAPMPGHTAIPFDDVKHIFAGAMREATARHAQ